MRTIRWRSLALLLAGALLALGCRRSPAPQPTSTAAAPSSPAPTAAAPSAAAAPAEQPASARLELGYEVDANGAIPRGLESRQFSAASKFMLAVRTDDLSAGARITVRWTDSAGAALGTENREVAAGTRFAAFASPDTSAWPTAAYRAAVEIDGQPSGAIDFRVEAPARPGA